MPGGTEGGPQNRRAGGPEGGGADGGRQPGDGEWRSRSPRSEAERVTEPGALWAAQGAMREDRRVGRVVS